MEFVSELPHVLKQNLEIGTEFSSVVYWRLKKVLIEIIWGTKFFSHFPKFFKAAVATDTATNTVTAAPSKAARKSIVVPLVLENGAMIEKFLKSSPQEFHLKEMFTVKLNNGKEVDVIFQQDDMMRALYLDSSFYSEVGPEFCLIFDIMYAKTGTEAVAESFYRVIEKQEMDGGQSQNVLSMRAKVDWCLPPVINCESVLSHVASLYINGDIDLVLKRYLVPIYRDKRSIRNNSDDYSEVVNRIVHADANLPFLL